MAFVVKKPGSNVDADTLLTYCAEKISERAAIPKRIEFIDAMPLTAVGKIFRPALRQRIAKLVLDAHLAKAGIAAAVQLEIEKKRGLVANIVLEDKSQRAAAEELLQGYTLAIVIS